MKTFACRNVISIQVPQSVCFTQQFAELKDTLFFELAKAGYDLKDLRRHFYAFAMSKDHEMVYVDLQRGFTLLLTKVYSANAPRLESATL